MKYVYTSLAVVLTLLIGCGVHPSSMTDQDEQDPWVIRTDFTDNEKWTKVRDLIAAPQTDMDQKFYAYVQYKDDQRYGGMDCFELVHSLPNDYPGFLCFLVDAMTISDDEHPILVVDFSPNSMEIEEDYQWTPEQTPLSDIKTFRAIPSTIQSIENNLSIVNMDFEDFANSVDSDGIFRGFPQ